MIAALERTRRCLTARGIRVVGGPVLPPVSPSSDGPDGELVVGNGAGRAVFIAFYTDSGRAQRLKGGLVQSARRLNGEVQRHDAVTVLSLHSGDGIRAAVHACALP